MGADAGGGPYGRFASDGWSTSFDPNEQVSWRAHIELDEVAAEPPNTISFDLDESWTPGNVVVKATGDPVILHHADDTSHSIGWTIDHCDDLDPVFAATVTVCDLSGNTVTTLTDPDAGIGAGSVAWNTNLPEDSGIYTYRIAAQHAEDPPWPHPCTDQDKSAVLTISNVSVTDFAWSQTRYPDYAFVRLHYTLSRAADAVEVQCYKRDLTLTAIDDPEAFPATAGTHDVLVEFAVDRAVMGPYRFVISADETAADGANNRDGAAKPALQKGATQVIWPPAYGAVGCELGVLPWISPYANLTMAETVDAWNYLDADGTRYSGDRGFGPSQAAVVATEALPRCAIVQTHTHGSPWHVTFNFTGVRDYWYDVHADPTNPVPPNQPAQDCYYIPDIGGSSALDHCLFVMYAGCRTAEDIGNGNRPLMDATSAKGADCVGGWEDGPCYLDLYLRTFWHETMENGLSVSDADNAAVAEVIYAYGAPGGAETFWCTNWTISLRPARFGQ